jgi:hypothetical protein
VISHRPLRFASVCGIVCDPKKTTAIYALPALWTYEEKLRIRNPMRRFQFSGGCSQSREQPQCCDCGENHTANARVYVKWNEAKAALAKQAPDRGRKGAATGHPATLKAQRTGPSVEQMDQGEG